MAFFLDGKVSLVIGTHTHVPTADHQVLPGGTAFMTDVGMTGDYDSCIGMAKEEPLSRFLRRIPSAKFEPALGPATLCGLAVETDDATGLARRVAPVRLGARLEEARPAFWGRDAQRLSDRRAQSLHCTAACRKGAMRFRLLRPTRRQDCVA